MIKIEKESKMYVWDTEEINRDKSFDRGGEKIIIQMEPGNRPGEYIVEAIIKDWTGEVENEGLL